MILKTITIKHVLLGCLIVISAAGCKRDPQPEPIKPRIDNLEIGIANSKRGIVGHDFHFNADVSAGDKIDVIQLTILQLEKEVYSSAWNFELTWEQYKGAKNANLHKHFEIPKSAPIGKYDFVITVTDQNGTTLKISEDFTIAAAGDVPPETHEIVRTTINE